MPSIHDRLTGYVVTSAPIAGTDISGDSSFGQTVRNRQT